MQSNFESCFLYGRAADVLAAAARPVRLRDDGFHRKFRTLREPPEGGHCKFRRATKKDAQGSHRGGEELPFAGLPQFADPALDQVSLEHAEVLKKKDAIEMVDLVAKGAGEEPLAAHFIDFALQILRAHGHIRRAQDISAETRQR